MSRVSALVPAVLVAVLLALAPGPVEAAAPGTPHQPGPPSHGPGATDYRYTGMKVARGGAGAEAFYVFEPTGATTQRAAARTTLPLAVITHGYFEFSGYDQMYELVRHTVLAGNVVIYPRWQTDTFAPCPGPLDIGPCMASATAGIRGGLRFLRTHPRWTQPRLQQASYFGFSFGGIITANLVSRWERLHLPKPRAVFLDDPHDGGFAGAGEPALDASLAGIPRGTRFVCHSGADGVISEPGKADSSCNAVFPRLTSIPATNKALVLTHTDDHGDPALSSEHGVCAGGRGAADAYDWGFCWRAWDALRANAYRGTWARYAPAGLPEHTSLGSWSDGTPVAPLTVQRAAPIGP